MQVYPEGTHLMVPWFERPVIYDVRARPHLVESTSGSRDRSRIKILSLSVLDRKVPDPLTTAKKKRGKQVHTGEYLTHVSTQSYTRPKSEFQQWPVFLFMSTVILFLFFLSGNPDYCTNPDHGLLRLGPKLGVSRVPQPQYPRDNKGWNL